MTNLLPRRLVVGFTLVALQIGFWGANGNTARSQSWPTFQSNPQRNAFVAADVNATALKELWVFHSVEPPQPAWHGPAKWDAYANLRGLHSMRNYDTVNHVTAAGDRVFFASSAAHAVACLDATSGDRLWTFFANGPVRVPPTFDEGLLFFGSDDGYAYCVHADNGQLVWKLRPADPDRLIVNNGNFIPLWPVRTGVTVTEGTAYFAASLLPWHTSYLCAVDAATGSVASAGYFVKELEGVTFEGSLAVSREFLIAPQGRVEPILFARTTGQEVGRLTGGGGAFVVVADDNIFHGPGNKEGWLTRSNAESRERVATHKHARAVVVVDDVTYLLTHQSVIALDATEKDLRWRASSDDGLSMIVVGSTIFVGGTDWVVAYARDDGRMMWNSSVDGRAVGLAFANSQLLVSTDTGAIIAYGEGMETTEGPFQRTTSTETSGSGLLDRQALKNSQQLALELPERHEESATASPFVVEVGPWLEFTSPTEAIIRWETAGETPSIVEWHSNGITEQIVDATPKTQHQLKIENLKRNRRYGYTIVQAEGKSSKKTMAYECDTFFNYEPVEIAVDPEDAINAARAILDRTKVTEGLCLTVGIESANLLTSLAHGSDLRVIALVDDTETASRMRTALADEGNYGSRVAVLDNSLDGKTRLTPHCANLVVTVADETPEFATQISRMLTPTGRGVVLPDTQNLYTDSRTALTRANLIHGKRIAGAGDWTHAYGRADNSAYGGESLGQARSRDDLVVQWVGRPGPRYQADRSGRKSPPLAVSGRLFLQGLNRIVAVDSFNGTIHWSLELPHFSRMNMPRDTSNWCADDKFLYAAVRDRCWIIDAADGSVVAKWPVHKSRLANDPHDWGYVAVDGQYLIGSAVSQGASWSDFWGGEGWYDATTGERAHKVCSRNVFARDKSSGSVRWEYSQGVILNSTMTIGDGRVCFVESRHPAVLAANAGRLGVKELWQEQFLVALDIATGELLWETPLDLVAGETSLSMAFGANRFVVVSSADGEFHTYTFDATSGIPLWTATSAWGKGKADHGTHLSRPAIVRNRLYIRPAVFDLETGEKLKLEMPISGCGTYACTDKAMFFRAWSGQEFAIWDMADGTYTRWPRLRPDCWLSSVPADGLMLSPEGGGGCSCGNWLETSLAFIPKVHLVP